MSISSLLKLIKPSLILITIAFVWSAEAANLSLERRISERLDNPALAGKALWLEAGESRFLAIHSPNSAKTDFGSALILHDAGAHADWKEVIQPLRLSLSKQGWNTLSLQLPRSAPPLNPDAFLKLLEQASPRIQAAVDYLVTQQQQTLVLIGHGLGSAMALYHMTKRPDQRIKAIAAIGLSIETEDKTAPVSQALAKLRTPLLDLYGSRDLTKVIESAAKRRQIAIQNKQLQYRQEQVTGADHFFSGLQRTLSKRVHAWLRRQTVSQTANE